ncbi:hypothetical protein, partial [Paenibacillus macerans]|uniref:hypothetical protein n=1 Tax=Paenibacillus macerans TaxID=44252 RepID=UPI0039EE02DD
AEEFAFSLPGALLTFWNRRMRTRMYGGVRGRGLVTLSYSITHDAAVPPYSLNWYKSWLTISIWMDVNLDILLACGK